MSTMTSLEIARYRLLEAYKENARDLLRAALQPVFEQVLTDTLEKLKVDAELIYEPERFGASLRILLLDRREK